MKLLQERFYVFISVLFTVLVFAFLISNFPVEEKNPPEQSPVADARIQTEKK
jgi:hypothetical protein